MHIVHALFTPVLGGLEQSYVNTTEVLAGCGHKVTALMRSDAPYRGAVATHAASVEMLNPLGFYDVFAAWKARSLLLRLRPDVIIAHNARSISLLCFAARGTGIPVIGVTHSYKTARTMRADALIVLSEHMRMHFLAAGYERQVKIIPNIIRTPPKQKPRERGEPPVIGAIGRFSSEKGIDDLLHALHDLKISGVPFKGVIAGDGPESAHLKALAKTLALDAQIEWPGWVHDKAEFYRGLDVLCVPSRQDSFPMVVLEGLAHGVAMVTTDAPGPAQILTNNTDALVVRRGDRQALISALTQLATRPELASRLAEAGRKTAEQYDFPAVARKWEDALSAMTGNK